MNFTCKLTLIILFLVLTGRVEAQPMMVNLTVGPTTGQDIVDAHASMGPNGWLRINIVPGANNDNTVFFNNVTVSDPNQVLNVVDNQQLEFVANPAQPIFFNGVSAPGRLATLSGSSAVRSAGISYQGWTSNSGSTALSATANSKGGSAESTEQELMSCCDGGVFLATGNSTLDIYRSQIADNNAQSFGGFATGTGNARILMTECWGYRNSAQYGGVVALLGSATARIRHCGLFNGQATSFGCTAHVESNGMYEYGSALVVDRSQVSGTCQNGELHMPFGYAFTRCSTIGSPDEAHIFTGNLYTSCSSNLTVSDPLLPNQLQAANDAGNKPEALCEDFGTGVVNSLGYNLAEDESCDLDQPSDLEGVDGMAADNGTGVLVPQPGSPLIDSGPIGTQVFPGETMESLNCSYKDLLGLGAPQDANNDGVFECDRGAVEVAGPGAMAPGHSSAFFNSLRNGEGQYVEMLSANNAVVYTFTYRPDGSGAAWFTGIGYVLGNSIVIDQLLRPSGTSFGDGFDSSQIVNAFAGGQSMVFNDCKAAAPGGNVAFSGNMGLGYEALVTRAERLSDVLGCGDLTPHPNAGLSGSYFLPARNGEGIVVQWLPNGQVLVIFFTYDLNGDQQWVTGIGTSDGFSVTIDALYPSSSTSWGSEFDPSEVVLSPWGTFELTWTECGGVQFSYNSTVPGYGSATRDYVRLSNLWETSCPDF